MEGMALLILYTNSSLPLYLSPWSSCGERQLTCSAGADHPPGSGPGSDPSSLQCSKIVSSWIFINYLRHSLNSQDAKVITVWHLFWSRACFQMQVRRLTLSNSHNWIYSFYLILFNTHTHTNIESERERKISIFHLLVCIPNAHISQGRAWLKPWAWISIPTCEASV